MTADRSREEWSDLVYHMLAAHPEYADVTVQAMQSGILAAVERQKDRVSTLSWGLHSALSYGRRAKGRNRKMIVDAIQVSNLHPTTWSAKMIQKEGELDP